MTRRTCSGSTRISVQLYKEVWTQRNLDIPPLFRTEGEVGRAGRNDIGVLPVLHFDDEEANAGEMQGEVDLFSADTDGVPAAASP